MVLAQPPAPSTTPIDTHLTHLISSSLPQSHNTLIRLQHANDHHTTTSHLFRTLHDSFPIAHSHSDHSHWPGRPPLGSLSHSSRQAAPDFPPRRQVSAASLTPAHTPIVTPSQASASLTAASSSSSLSTSSISSITTSTSASSTGSSSRTGSPYAMSRIPQVGHAPVSAALQAQALEAMHQRPAHRHDSSSPPPESAPGGSGYTSAGGMNSGISSRKADASHRRRSHGGAGPMRTTGRPHTPGVIPSTGGSAVGGHRPPASASKTVHQHSQPTRAFVLERLHEYAPAVLSNPRTSDVRIVVPSRQSLPPDSRRGSEPHTPTPTEPKPKEPTATVRFYALHRDYLVPQSVLFRNILTGGFKDGAPELRGCRLLPYTSLHGPRPVYVPLPDPDSFDALIHWMYFGDVAKLEAQLSSGEVQWRGLIRNIQYLGCDERTRSVVAKWWQRWAANAERRAQGGRGAGKPKDDDSDDEEDEDGHRKGGVARPHRRGVVVPGNGAGVDGDDGDDEEGRESSYDNADDKSSSPWRSDSADNLNYSVDADEMARRLGGL